MMNMEHGDDLDPESEEDQEIEVEIQIVTNFDIMKTSFHNFDEFTHFRTIY